MQIICRHLYSATVSGLEIVADVCCIRNYSELWNVSKNLFFTLSFFSAVFVPVLRQLLGTPLLSPRISHGCRYREEKRKPLCDKIFKLASRTDVNEKGLTVIAGRFIFRIYFSRPVEAETANVLSITLDKQLQKCQSASRFGTTNPDIGQRQLDENASSSESFRSSR